MNITAQTQIDFGQLISEKYKDLTKSEKQIAGYLRNNQEEAAFLSVGELASRLDLSDATLVRFARSLGFDSYPAMREVLQENFRRRVTHSARLRSRLDDLREAGDLFERLVVSEMDYMTQSLDQGEFVMLGALSFVTLRGGCHLPIALAFPVTVVSVALLGMVFERLAIRTVRRPYPIVLVIITVGVSIFLRGMAMLSWGKDSYGVSPFSQHPPLRIGGASLLPQSLWILAIVLITVMGLQAFFKRTLTGKAMQACAINKRAAWLLGIPSESMVLFAFAISAGMGAVAGMIIAPITMCSYDMGTLLGLKGFCAAMLGGLGSSMGAVLGGFLWEFLSLWGSVSSHQALRMPLPFCSCS